jgi:hypothetical protein
MGMGEDEATTTTKANGRWAGERVKINLAGPFGSKKKDYVKQPSANGANLTNKKLEN